MTNNVAVILSKPGNRELQILFSIMMLTVLLRLIFLYEPFERDEGLYAYMGQEILRGAIPYRDVIDHKPPGIHYLYAFMIAVAGPTTLGIRIFTALYASLTTAAVYAVSRRAAGILAGQIASLLYAIYSGMPILQGSSSNSEVFMVFPIILSIYFSIRFIDTEKRYFLVASGISIAAAVLIKTVALPIAVLLFLIILFAPGNKSIKMRILDLLAFILPQLLIIAGVLAYFYRNDALRDFYFWNVSFNAQYGALSFDQRTEKLISAFDAIAEHGALWLIGVPAITWLIFIKRTRSAVLLGLLVPMSFVGVSMPGFYFPHYFIQMISPLTIVSGVALASLYEYSRSAFRVISSVLIAIVCYFWAFYDYPYYFQYSANKVSSEKYGDIFVGSVKIADYLRGRIKPGAYLYQWGFEPELYFLTGTRAPNRFTIYRFVDKSNEDELYKSLIMKRPEYIIVQTWEPLPGMKAVKRAVDHEYFLEQSMGCFELWRLKM